MSYIVFKGEKVPCIAEVVDGRNVPTRDGKSVCWFDKAYAGFRKRKAPITAVAVHYTASDGGSAQIYNTLRTRKNAQGKPLNLGVHFTVEVSGRIVQHCDIADVVMHIGSANEWTVGIEIANRAVGDANKKPVREPIEQTIHGRKGKFLKYLPAQEAAAKSLVKDLCRILGLPLTIPRDASGSLVTGVMSPKAMAQFRGVIGHFHVSASKRDPLPYLMELLVS